MKNISLVTTTLAISLCLSTLAHAQLTGFTKVVTETELLSVQNNPTAKADYDASGMKIGPTGTIYAIDSDNGTPTNQSIIRIVPGSPNTIGLMATHADMLAAINAVNGTTPDSTTFSPRQIGVLANGNIVVGGFSSVGSAETILILTDAAPATITVLHTSVDLSFSAVDGLTGMTIIGNTIYCSTDENNGNVTTADALVSFNGTAAGPTAAATTILTKAQIESGLGATAVANECALNDMTNDGTDIYAIVSASTTSPDVVVKITTAGVLTLHLNKTSVVSALTALDATATDVGYGAIGIDNSGTLYLANNFGVATSAYDDNMIVVGNITAGAGTVRTSAKTVLATDFGITTGTTPFLANDSFSYVSTTNRMYFNEGSNAPTTNEGIWYLPKVSFAAGVADWNTY